MILARQVVGLWLLGWAITFNVVSLMGYADAYDVLDVRAAVRIFGGIVLTIGFAAVHLSRRLLEQSAAPAAISPTALQGAGVALVSLGFIDRSYAIWDSGVANVVVLPLAIVLIGLAVEASRAKGLVRQHSAIEQREHSGVLRVLGAGLAASFAATLLVAGLVQFETALRTPYPYGLLFGAFVLLFFAVGYLQYGKSLTRDANRSARMAALGAAALPATALLVVVEFHAEAGWLVPLGVIIALGIGLRLALAD